MPNDPRPFVDPDPIRFELVAWPNQRYRYVCLECKEWQSEPFHDIEIIPPAVEDEMIAHVANAHLEQPTWPS
jgi:hypothetical protein